MRIAALAAELDTRLKYARIQKEGEFYILLDTRRRQFAFKYGDKVVREASLDSGAPRIIQAKDGARWTFAPVTGAFTVKEKLENAEGFDKDHWPSMADTAWAVKVHEYYEVVPYWEDPLRGTADARTTRGSLRESPIESLGGLDRE